MRIFVFVFLLPNLSSMEKFTFSSIEDDISRVLVECTEELQDGDAQVMPRGLQNPF